MTWLRRASIVGCLVAATTAVVFLPCVTYDFVDWDDPFYVSSNPTVLGGLSWHGICRAFTEVHMANWAPLTMLSYQADATLFGPQPWGFHLSNVILHSLTAAGLCACLRRMTGATAASAAAAILFALHPQRVESVAWISDRKDLLSGFFLVVSLVAYERHARKPTIANYACVTAAMTASLMSKSTTVVLPALLLLCDYWPLRRAAWPQRRAWEDHDGGRYPRRTLAALIIEKLPLLAIAAIFTVVTIRTHSADVSHVAATTVHGRIVNAWNNLAWYAEKAVFPVALHPMQQWQARDSTRGFVMLGVAGGLVAMAFAFRSRLAKTPAIAAVAWGAAWFVVASLTTLGLFSQVGVSPHADRYTYIPHMGLAVAVVWPAAAAGTLLQGTGAAYRGITRLYAVILTVAIACIAATESQLLLWKDSRSFFSGVLKVDPENVVALTGAGEDADFAGDYNRATMLLEKAVDSAPEVYPPAVAALASLYARLGRGDEALALCTWLSRIDKTGELAAAVEKSPEVRQLRQLKTLRPTPKAAEESHDSLAQDQFQKGMVAVKKRDWRAAILAFQDAVAIEPGWAAAHNNLGMSAIELGDRDTAFNAFQRAAELDPAQPDYAVNLTRTLLLLGRRAEARVTCEAASRLAPRDPEIRRLYASLLVD